MCGKKRIQHGITPEMTVLDVVSAHKETLPVFKEYDAIAGECICCKSLFEPISNIAEKYDFNLQHFLKRLNATVLSNPL